MAISVVLALLGAPFMKLLSKIKIGKRVIPDSLTALLTLIGMYGIIFLILWLFVPLIVEELRFLATLNFGDVLHAILDQFPGLSSALANIGTEEQVKETIIEQANTLMNFQNVKLLVNDAASIGGTLAGGLLAVSFITYFLLKEETMVYRSILLITPSQYESEVKDILRTTRLMLTKYFTGLLADVLIVTVLVGGSMYFFGIKNALVIGAFAGIMNIIPYIGPLISFVFAIFLGVTGCFQFNEIDQISAVITKIFFILLAVNIFDGIIFQPFIFSSSVKAHPLEIFLVILMAATLAGIWGMVIAIPTYTFLRVVAKEFLTNFKFFKKITENIPE